jgi:hypothetical protein
MNSRDCGEDYDQTERSRLPPLPKEVWHALGGFLDSPADSTDRKSPDVLSSLNESNLLPQYIAQMDNISQCVANCLPFIDLSDDHSLMIHAFPFVKRALRRSFRESLWQVDPLLQCDRHSRPSVTVRWHGGVAPHQLDPNNRIGSTVLAQLYRQLSGALRSPQGVNHDPLFITNLIMSESGHVPIDAGGPYNQVWSLLAEELMVDDEVSEGLKRNPLFRFAKSKRGRGLVPEHKCCMPHEISLFTFLGQMLGYLTRARRPLAVEFSPFVWKYFVEDELTVKDYIEDVDAAVMGLLGDNDDLLLGEEGEADVVSPEAARSSHHTTLDAVGMIDCKRTAELAAVHSMDAQLQAIREGLWSVLGRGNVRMMTFGDLELLVCGVPNPSFEQVQGSVSVSLPPDAAELFWAALRAMTPEEWSSFFFFASAQRRYPLSRKITVSESKQSPDHLPTASTCFSHVTTPLYPSLALWVSKFREALGCSAMELA